MKTKIFIACHKPTKKLDGELFQYVLGGASLLAQRSEYGAHATRWKEQDIFWKNVQLDNTGENISNKNEIYNELTVIYWIWKNINVFKEIDNIGFCHYRRHFVLNENLRPKGERWTVDFPSISNQECYLEKIALNSTEIEKNLTSFSGIGSAISLPFTVREHYQLSEKHDHHIFEDLLLLEKIIKEDFPDFSPYFKAYLNSNTHFYGNSFILPKLIFCEYAELIFKILKVFERKVDLSKRSIYSRRLFVSERLTGAFFFMLEKQGKSIKKVPLSYINTIEEFKQPSPYFGKTQNTICFATDEKYLPYLSVTLRSLLDNLNDGSEKYEFVILHKTLSQEKIKRFLSNFEDLDVNHFKVTPLDISPLIEDNKTDFYIEIHVTEATYYRFYIQKIFGNFNKVLYLDSDLIILDDINKLFTIETNKPLSACKDIRENIAYALELKVSKNVNWKNYLEHTLNLKEGEYFQAGVLLFNIKTLVNIDLFEECKIALETIKKPILSDQDVLNKVFRGKVNFIDPAWNVEWQIPLEFGNLERTIPASYYEIYKPIYSSPKIVHYASPLKPWLLPDAPLAYLWWNSAIRTNYYSSFIIQAKESLLVQKSLIRNLTDSILPRGTLRRQIVKKIIFRGKRFFR